MGALRKVTEYIPTTCINSVINTAYIVTVSAVSYRYSFVNTRDKIKSKRSRVITFSVNLEACA